MSILGVQRRRAVSSIKRRQPQQDLEAIEEQMTRKIRIGTMIEADRKDFARQAEQIKTKNLNVIDKLRQENYKLKDMRDQLIAEKRNAGGTNRTLSSIMSGISNPAEIRDEGFYRRELDRQRFQTKTLKKNLTVLRDKLQEVENNKIGIMDENPLMRQIRILENRLDKIMIKYNQAFALRETYEGIVKRLKEERMGYDNQLTAIERSLKDKKHDFEELLLLAHDANHAKQQAQVQLKKLEHKRTAVKDLRQNYLSEKRQTSDSFKNPVQTQLLETNHSGYQAANGQEAPNPDEDDQLVIYHEAFRRLQETTGVSDINQIIQKFRNQNSTMRSLYELKERYRQTIEDLHKSKEDTRKELEAIKYQQPAEPGSFVNADRKKIEEAEKAIQKVHLQCERAKVRYQKLVKNLINIKAGVEHLVHNLGFPRPDSDASGLNEQVLTGVCQKIAKVYSTVKNHPSFRSENFKQSLTGVENYLRAEDLSKSRVSRKPKKDKELEDDENDDEDEDDTTSRQIKQRDQLINQPNSTMVPGNASANGLGYKRVLKKVVKKPLA